MGTCLDQEDLQASGSGGGGGEGENIATKKGGMKKLSELIWLAQQSLKDMIDFGYIPDEIRDDIHDLFFLHPEWGEMSKRNGGLVPGKVWTMLAARTREYNEMWMQELEGDETPVKMEQPLISSGTKAEFEGENSAGDVEVEFEVVTTPSKGQEHLTVGLV